jgi:hypothetical protein
MTLDYADEAPIDFRSDSASEIERCSNSHSPDAESPSHDLGRRLLPGHEHNIPRIAQLAGELRYPAARDANEVDVLKLGFADMSRILRRRAAVVTQVGLARLDGITKVASCIGCPATGFTYTSLFFRHFILLYRA